MNLSPASVAITDQILALLGEEAPLPVSTSKILERLNLRGYESTVHRLLNRLARRGEVEKGCGPDPDGSRSCYWRRLTPPVAVQVESR